MKKNSPHPARPFDSRISPHSSPPPRYQYREHNSSSAPPLRKLGKNKGLTQLCTPVQGTNIIYGLTVRQTTSMRPAEFSVLPVSRLRIQHPSSGCGRACERATNRTSSSSGPETFKISQCTSSRRFGTLLAGKFDIPSQDDQEATTRPKLRLSISPCLKMDVDVRH